MCFSKISFLIDQLRLSNNENMNPQYNKNRNLVCILCASGGYWFLKLDSLNKKEMHDMSLFPDWNIDISFMRSCYGWVHTTLSTARTPFGKALDPDIKLLWTHCSPGVPAHLYQQPCNILNENAKYLWNRKSRIKTQIYLFVLNLFL